jgi:hypothetical protein
MALTALTEAAEIRSAYDVLNQRLRDGAESHRKKVGHQGKTGVFSVYWRPKERFWSLFEPYFWENRYWCCLGTWNPDDNSVLDITCEINCPHHGVNRRIAGAFARDADGRLYVTHSGRVGGGRKGIGKSAFLECYGKDNMKDISWPDGKVTKAIVIGQLNGRDLCRQTEQFLQQINYFKNTVASGALPVSFGVGNDRK